jgi:predicted O-linked N-acetylglucosamine transferase (SPINDLY family)
VGYFSADFREHPVAQLLVELLERHDRSRFAVSGFSFGPDTGDALRQRVAAACERFVDVRERADAEVALLARELELDIAVDLTGFTDGCRPNIFALRAAPIQVSYLGYPATMGAPYIDYLIADATVVPPAQQRHYAERIAYLPHSFLVTDTTRAVAARAFTRTELGLPEHGVVFCAFHNSYKIVPATFGRWMRILERVPDSVLWLREENAYATANLRQEAARRGVDGNRLIFAPRMPSPAEHLARQRCADLFLDALPYNAHTTASDALWAGLPVLTCLGETFAGRVAASLLHAIGLPELVTATTEAYEAMAIALATDPARLGALKEKLARNRLTTPLFDTVRFARHLEAAYTAMYERHQADLPPDHIVVPA